MERDLPQAIKKWTAGHVCTLDHTGLSGSEVWLFEDWVLKIEPAGMELANEAQAIAWLQGRLPVPEIRAFVIEDGWTYDLMTRLPGKMLCDTPYMEDEKKQLAVLTEVFDSLWAIDITDCPCQQTLDIKLKQARENVLQGRVDLSLVEPETFGPDGFKDPMDLLCYLETHRPTEDLVFCHGDLCLPNILGHDQKLSGLIDLGRMGIADRWQDLALCYRSLRDNARGCFGDQVYANQAASKLFRRLGVVPDQEKLRYYLLLDELF